jgi:hypothetical protein
MNGKTAREPEIDFYAAKTYEKEDDEVRSNQ